MPHDKDKKTKTLERGRTNSAKTQKQVKDPELSPEEPNALFLAESRELEERLIRQRYELNNPGKTPDPEWIKFQVEQAVMF